MRPHVISTHHSGTRFLTRLLKCKHNHVDAIGRQQPLDVLYVVPVRNPVNVMASWIRRDHMATHRLVEEYQLLHSFVVNNRSRVHMQSIDTPLRYQEFNDLKTLIRRPSLETTWQPYGMHPHSHRRGTEDDRLALSQIIDEHHEWLEPWYPLDDLLVAAKNLFPGGAEL